MQHRTKPLDRSWWRQLALTLWVIGAAAFLGFLFHLILPARAEDQGYFNCLHLDDEQVAWFGTRGISPCCKLADGMPTRFEERPDGVFVPAFSEGHAEAVACRDGVAWGGRPGEDHSGWVRVIDDVVLRKPNPIGVGVIWWTNSGAPDGPGYVMEHAVRCFVGLPKA